MPLSDQEAFSDHRSDANFMRQKCRTNLVSRSKPTLITMQFLYQTTGDVFFLLIETDFKAFSGSQLTFS